MNNKPEYEAAFDSIVEDAVEYYRGDSFSKVCAATSTFKPELENYCQEFLCDGLKSSPKFIARLEALEERFLDAVVLNLGL